MAKNINLTLRGTDKFSPAAKSAKGSTDSLAGSIAKTTAAFAAIALGTRAVVNAAREYVGLATKQIEANQKLETILSSMGGTAGYTAAELREMASSLQSATTYGDEAIIDLQGTLATFAHISGDVFARTTEVALDLSAAFGQDLSSSAVQLGKALDDPMTGLTALRRVGVSFSEEQKELIKSLVETNRVTEAQGIILDALESQVGGVARAMGDTSAGALKQFNNALGDLKEIGGMVILDFIEPAIRGMTTFAESITTALKNARELKDALSTGNSSNLTTGGVDREISRLQDAIREISDEITQNAIDRFNSLNPGEWATALSDLPMQIQQDVMYSIGENVEIKRMSGDIAQWSQFLPELAAGSSGGGVTGSVADEISAQIIALRDEAREQIEILREQSSLIHGQDLSDEETRKVWTSALEGMVKVLVENGQEVKHWIGPGTVIEQALNEIATNTDSLDRATPGQFGLPSQSTAPEWWNASSGTTGSGAYDTGAYQHSGAGGSMSTLLSRSVADIRMFLQDAASTFQSAMSSAFSGLAAFGQWIMNLITSSQPFVDMMAALSEQFAAAILPAVQELVVALQPLLSFVVQIVQIVGESLIPIFQMLGMFILGLQPLFAALVPVFQALMNVVMALMPVILSVAQILILGLVPILSALTPLLDILVMVIQALNPVFELLAWTLKVVMTPIATLGAIFEWLFSIIANFGQFIRNVINHPLKPGTWNDNMRDANLGKMIADAVAGVWSADQPSDYNSFIPSDPGSTNYNADTFANSQTSLYGGNTTVQRVPDIYVYQTLSGPIIGNAGLRDVGQFVVTAIQAYVGTGGAVSFSEAS